MPSTTPNGYQPGTLAPERRAFFDLQRKFTDLQRQISDLEGVVDAIVPGINAALAPAWIAPTLGGSWVNLGSGFQNTGYRKIGDIVHLRGLIASGTIGGTAFILPVGYRPASSWVLATASAGAYGECRVYNDGTVVPFGGSNVWFAFDNLSFSMTA